MSYELLAWRVTNVNLICVCCRSYNNLFFVAFWLGYACYISIYMCFSFSSLLDNKIYLYKFLRQTNALQSQYKFFSSENSIDRCYNQVLCCSSLFWCLNYTFRSGDSKLIKNSSLWLLYCTYVSCNHLPVL